MDTAAGNVLVADDEKSVLTLLERTLITQNYRVRCVSDGEAALEACKRNNFDAIITDIDMPGLSGIELLKAVRSVDPDVPVLLITGEPTVDGAIRAIRYGAFRLFPKPLDMEDLLESLAYASQVHRLAQLKRQALKVMGDNDKQASDLAGLERDFECALNSLWMAFQPIVSVKTRGVMGYEALLRSVDPALPHPGAILDAAERLKRLPELGSRIRDQVAAEIASLPKDQKVFVNLHPADLTDDTLYSRVAPLSRFADQVILEITERVDLDEIDGVEKRAQALRDMGFRLAVDDLGSGYAGLTSFVRLKPEIVKMDMSLIRDVHLDSSKQRLVKALVELCESMGIQSVIEGVESPDEAMTLIDLGADLMQGYLFASPGVPFPQVEMLPLLDGAKSAEQPRAVANAQGK